MMNNGLLKDINTSVIFNLKEKNAVRRLKAAVRYVDGKECYISTEFIGDFNKPKPKAKAEIIAKTKCGVYKAEVVIVETSVSLNEIIFVVTAPQDWEAVEFRKNMRINVTLPVTIRFDDGMELKSITDNISIGGLSFVVKEEKDIENYKHQIAQVTLELPDREPLIVNAKFLRSDAAFVNLYTYKFIALSSVQELVLTRFLREILLI